MEFRGEKFQRISQEFLETESQNCDPTKISHLSWGPIPGNFSRISEESVTGNDSREVPRKVTTVGESGEIPHFCYLGI